MKTKKEFRYFSIFHHEKEEAYLQDMHRAGWRLLKVSGFGAYHFEACEPEEVVYQLDYNKEGLAHKQEYVQMFRDCGWEHIGDFVDYSYFRKPAAEMREDEGIFCDDASRLAMLWRVFCGRLLPLSVILLACLVPQLVLNLCSFHNYGLAIFFGALIGVYVGLISAFLVKCFRFGRRIKK